MRYRLRSILHENGREEEAGVVLESTGRLRDWLIITVPSDISHRQLQHFRNAVREKFGEKTMVLAADVKFCVFEEVVGAEEPVNIIECPECRSADVVNAKSEFAGFACADDVGPKIQHCRGCGHNWQPEEKT